MRTEFNKKVQELKLLIYSVQLVSTDHRFQRFQLIIQIEIEIQVNDTGQEKITIHETTREIETMFLLVMKVTIKETLKVTIRMVININNNETRIVRINNRGQIATVNVIHLRSVANSTTLNTILF